MHGNDSSSSDAGKPDDYSSFAPPAKMTNYTSMNTEKRHWARYKASLYPFSTVLRFRVIQIVCGIIMMVMGSVACIEEKGTVTNLGLGVFAGIATVIASAACIHTSRGFGGYRQPSCSGGGGTNPLFRFLGPTLHAASFLTCLWMVAGCFNLTLLTRSLYTIIHGADQASETSYLLAIVQGSLSMCVLVTAVFIARVDCTYDPD
ncbi:uncharacterized protein LOC135843565 [Planococcus citri]|uniref:uncharacterized protein LOC135843565 n=1 Tax=Planococcus citri TaxID=170843 RepID=UPI0031F90362